MINKTIVLVVAAMIALTPVGAALASHTPQHTAAQTIAPQLNGVLTSLIVALRQRQTQVNLENVVLARVSVILANLDQQLRQSTVTLPPQALTILVQQLSAFRDRLVIMQQERAEFEARLQGISNVLGNLIATLNVMIAQGR